MLAFVQAVHKVWKETSYNFCLRHCVWKGSDLGMRKYQTIDIVWNIQLKDVLILILFEFEASNPVCCVWRSAARDVVFPQRLVRTFKFCYQFLVALNDIYIPHGVSNDMYLALYSIFS